LRRLIDLYADDPDSKVISVNIKKMETKKPGQMTGLIWDVNPEELSSADPMNSKVKIKTENAGAF